MRSRTKKRSPSLIWEEAPKKEILDRIQVDDKGEIRTHALSDHGTLSELRLDLNVAP